MFKEKEGNKVIRLHAVTAEFAELEYRNAQKSLVFLNFSHKKFHQKPNENEDINKLLAILSRMSFHPFLNSKKFCFRWNTLKHTIESNKNGMKFSSFCCKTMKYLVFWLFKCSLVFGEFSNLINYSQTLIGPVFEDENATSRACEGEDSSRPELLGLINFVAEKYLSDCVNVILYDSKFEDEAQEMNFNLRVLLKEFPGDYVNGQISENNTINVEFLTPQKNKCTHFLLFIPDLTRGTKLLGQQTINKVVVITLATRWKIEEYLQKQESRMIVNLLIVSHIWKQDIFFGLEERSTTLQYTNLYTHNLFTDPVGSSTVKLLTAWRCGKLTRDVNLFPPKMKKGFNGKQFVVAASQQPPFTFKKSLTVEEDSNESFLWDGVEIRILRLLADFMNYTMEIKEPKMSISKSQGPSEIVIADVVAGLAEIGSAGVYVTNQRLTEIWLSVAHSTDCAAFITKATTSLPRYRAILGPFQLSVWITLTIAYLIAVIPLTFADSHSLKPLIKNPWLIEDMFWHVFGTFTNLFTFSGENSWSKTDKNASRLLIGSYWAFSIIVTACYTGSIVSFITLFVFPDVTDHIDQLVKQNFRIGTLSTAGWGTWFNNSEHEQTKWLLRDLELVPNTAEGLRNVSKSVYLPMFRPYAFLAGRAQMEYIVQANYTTNSRKQKLHITKDCFVPFGVSFVFPTKAIYADTFNEYILRMQQSGLMGKLLNEFKWEVERTSSGKLLQAGSGKHLREAIPIQRKLTLDDTQGMYLLLGSGFLLAFTALIGERINNRVKNKQKVTTPTQSLSSGKVKKFVGIRLYVDRVLSSLRGRMGQENYQDDHSDYDDTAYKKYDSRILKTHRLHKSQSRKQTPYVTEAVFSGANRKRIHLTPNLRSEENLEDIAPSGTREYKENENNADAVNSITSLPWEWGSDLHFRRNVDQDRLHTS